MTPAQLRIRAEINQDSATEDLDVLLHQRWPYRFSMGADLNAHRGVSTPEVMIYQSRDRHGLWVAMLTSDSRQDWMAGPGSLEDVVDDAVDFMLDETVRATPERLALARAEQAARWTTRRRAS